MAKLKHKIPKSIHLINLALQTAHIQRCFPSFSCQIRKGYAVWCGSLQPRVTSPAYQVEIHYKLMDIPKVKIISPPLSPKTPHVYAGGFLCLYWPDEWRWRQDRLIAETILPWTASWLYYYELWLDTDQWLGPSSHDNLAEQKICQHA